MVSESAPGAGPGTAVESALVTENTECVFFSRRYRVVFALDVSPSISTVDPSTGSVTYESVFESFRRCFVDLTKPLHVGGGERPAIQPEIWVTVLAQTNPLVQPTRYESVLLQPTRVTAGTAATLVQGVHARLQDLENLLSETVQTAARPPPDDAVDAPHDEHPGGGDGRPKVALKRDLTLVQGMFNSIAAIKMMPSDASPVLIIVTDGVVSVSEPKTLTKVLEVLNRHEIPCSFIQTGQAGLDWNCSFGAVPDIELLQFIAAATGGHALFATDLARTQAVLGTVANASQRAFFCSSVSCAGRKDAASSLTSAAYAVNEYLTSEPSALPQMRSSHADGFGAMLAIPTATPSSELDRPSTPSHETTALADLLLTTASADSGAVSARSREVQQYSVPMIRRKWKRYTADLPILA